MKHEFNFPTEASQSEKASRSNVALRCEVRHGQRPWKLVRLENLSQAGFQIAWLPDARMGQALKIQLPGLQALDAKIRWLRGKVVGCEFSTPLHVAVFDHILRQAEIEGS